MKAGVARYIFLIVTLVWVQRSIAQDGLLYPDIPNFLDFQVDPKRQCNEFLAEKAAFDKSIQAAVEAMDQSIVARHAAFFAQSVQMGASVDMKIPVLSETQEQALARDLDSMLGVVWLIEMKVVRKFYSGPEHSSRFPHLQVKLDPESEMDAWACFDDNTIQISPLLIKNMWLNSLNQETKEGIEPGIRSPAKLLDVLRMTKPIQKLEVRNIRERL
jgi:hypothetical protein